MEYIPSYFENFCEVIDYSCLKALIYNILNREIDIKYKEKFCIWLHKKTLRDKNIIKAIDPSLINEIYKYISNENILNIIDGLDKQNISKIECCICCNNINKPTAGDCGHIFCKECMDKYTRVNRLRDRQVELKCPKCRENVGELRRIFI